MDSLPPFDFELPTRIRFGAGLAGQLADIVSAMGIRRPLVVTDDGVRSAGLLDGPLQDLARCGLDAALFDAVDPNPKDHQVEAGAERARDHGADGLVALGGGSPIDCAKAIAAAVANPGPIRALGNPTAVRGAPLPLVAVPTTAGTGSEVTFGAVITDTGERFKFTVKHRNLAPRLALLDPELTASMPPALTAATGMDALTHAVEAYTAKGAQPLSDALALQAVELIALHLRTAVLEGGNPQARSAMLAASLLAGIAFSHADVAAVHCLAEALGGRYDTPHGVCNAVVLPEMMAYNTPACQPRYARLAAAMGIGFDNDAHGAGRAVDAVRQLARDVGLPPFSSFGVPRADFAAIAEASARNGSNPSNPRPMAVADYLRVLDGLASGG